MKIVDSNIFKADRSWLIFLPKRYSFSLLLLLFSSALFLFISLSSFKKTTVFNPKPKLSHYGFFEGNISAQIPKKAILPYSLKTPLFSDYAEKLRFIYLPASSKINYKEHQMYDYPEGTVIIKTFYYPLDFRKPENGRNLLETRLLVKDNEDWKTLSYIWNEDQSDADLEVAGGEKTITYLDQKGKTQTVNYNIPNVNQCKGCHNQNEKVQPIGPKSLNLNTPFDYGNGPENQLTHWKKLGLFSADIELPNAPENTLENRARAYLDINCAHCHSENGAAKTSGLDLSYYQTDLIKIGVNKSPVAAGRGSGNLDYDLVPGKPEKSILYYRMASTDPGIMMPELGRSKSHKEGLELIRTWIKEMK